MNKVVMMGRLTREPEVRYTGANNKAVAKFSLAVDRRYTRDGEPDVDFFNCTAFGKTAEHIESYWHKGMKALIEGHAQTGSYTNKEGQRVNTFDIIIDNIEFCERKESQLVVPNVPNESSDSGDGFMSIPDGIDEDLPFN